MENIITLSEALNKIYEQLHLALDYNKLARYNHKLIRVRGYDSKNKTNLNGWAVCHYDEITQYMTLIAGNHRLGSDSVKYNISLRRQNKKYILKYTPKMYSEIIHVSENNTTNLKEDMLLLKDLYYWHWYLQSKNIIHWQRYGFKTKGKGLIVPYHSNNGYQHIYKDAEGNKQVRSKGTIKGEYYFYQLGNKPKFILMAEGMANIILPIETLETHYKNLSCIGISTFGVNNALIVIGKILNKYKLPIIFFIDNDPAGRKLAIDLEEYQNKIFCLKFDREGGDVCDIIQENKDFFLTNVHEVFLKIAKQYKE